MAKPKIRWRYITPSGPLECLAYTKSEARALFKRAQDLLRLPIGAVIEAVGKEEINDSAGER